MLQAVPRLRFETVPEIGLHQLPGLMDAIAARIQQHLPSFGAHVIRGGGEAAAKSSEQELLRALGRTQALWRAPFSSRDEVPVHRDSDTPNAPAIHLTDTGRARGIILMGGDTGLRPHELRGYPSDNGCQFTARLFETGEFSGPVLPDYAYSVEVGAGDVIVFDQGLDHGFKSLTPDRHSTTRFLPLS